MYKFETPRRGDYNELTKHILHDEIRTFRTIYVELSEELPWDSNTSSNQPSVSLNSTVIIIMFDSSCKFPLSRNVVLNIDTIILFSPVNPEFLNHYIPSLHSRTEWFTVYILTVGSSGSTLFAKLYDAKRMERTHAICGQRRPWLACAFTQANQGLHCPLSESMDIVVYVDEQRMSRSNCTDAHAHTDLRCWHMT